MAGVKQIANPSGAFGLNTSNDMLGPQETDEYKASATCTGPGVVSIGTNTQIALSATNGTASLCVGITPNTIASGNTGQVVVRGIVKSVPATGAVAAGDVLKRSVTTTGSVSATATPATGESIGVAIAASASNVVDVYVCIGR